MKQIRKQVRNDPQFQQIEISELQGKTKFGKEQLMALQKEFHLLILARNHYTEKISFFDANHKTTGYKIPPGHTRSLSDSLIVSNTDYATDFATMGIDWPTFEATISRVCPDWPQAMCHRLFCMLAHRSSEVGGGVVRKFAPQGSNGIQESNFSALLSIDEAQEQHPTIPQSQQFDKSPHFVSIDSLV